MMSVKVVTSWLVLMSKAKKVGQAKKDFSMGVGSIDKINEAEKELEDYRSIVSKSDSMVL